MLLLKCKTESKTRNKTTAQAGLPPLKFKGEEPLLTINPLHTFIY